MNPRPVVRLSASASDPERKLAGFPNNMVMSCFQNAPCCFMLEVFQLKLHSGVEYVLDLQLSTMHSLS